MKRVSPVLIFPVIGVLLYLIVSFMNLDSYAGTWDEVDFVLALDKFDLLAMQPHFPGYPYFVLGGMLLHQGIAEPIEALIVFNFLFAASTLWPIYAISVKYVSQLMAWIISFLVVTSPYLWLLAAQPMSEAAGIAALWWFLWAVRYAMDKPNSLGRAWIPAMMFGLLMGIRLSYAPFGVLLMVYWVLQWKAIKGSEKRITRGLRLKAAAIHGLLFIFFQGLWLYGLALSEGGIAGFVRLSWAFVRGHFTEWGGGVGSEQKLSLVERSVTLFGDHLLWSTLSGRSSLLLIVILGLCLFTMLVSIQKLKQMNWIRNPFLLCLLGSVVLYALWVLFGQNIEKPRHIAPVVGPMLLVLFVAIARSLGGAPKAAIIIGGVVLVIQAAVGADLLRVQAQEVPTTYALHDYLEEQSDPFIVYTWEETRVFSFLHAAYAHKRIESYDYFVAEAKAEKERGRRVLLTEHVLQGFETQLGRSLREHVTLLQSWHGNSLVDPVYGDNQLYEWR